MAETITLDSFRAETAAVLAEMKLAHERSEMERKRYGEVLGETDAKLETINNKLADLAQVKDRLERLETAANRPEVPAHTDEEKAAKEKAAFGAYLRKGDQAPELKVLSAGVATGAGYLQAPAAFERAMIKPIDEYTPFRSIANVRQISVSEWKQPSRTAVFSASWVAEAGTRAETTGLTVGMESILPHELYARVDVTNHMLEDAMFDLESYLAEEFAMQFAVAEGAAFCTGNGVGKPMGFVTTLIAASSYTALGHASTITSLDGLIDLQHAIKTGHAVDAVWLMRRATIGVLRKAKGGDGQYLWEPSSQVADPYNFLGNRIVEAPDIAAIASNAYAVAFGNFRRGYVIVDRVGTEILRDPYSSSSTGAVQFTARRRVGGSTVLAEAMRLGKISTS